MPAQETSPIISTLSNDADMAELIQDFVACLGERVAAIDVAVQADNLAEITRLAHQLKGASGGYGFQVIGDTAAQLESASKAVQSVNQIRGEVDRLIDLCRRATAATPEA